LKTSLLLPETEKRSTRLSKLLQAVHQRRQVTWEAFGRELGVSGRAVALWRDEISSPGKESLEGIAAHPSINWTPQQLDLYLDGKFDDKDIEELLDKGIAEGTLPLIAVKQAMTQYSEQELLELISFGVERLKSAKSENSSQKKITDSQKSIKTPRTRNRASSDNFNGNTKEEEKMPIQLSRLADIRLRPLLRDSLVILGFDKDFKAAAQWACVDAEDAEVLAPILKHLVAHRFNPRIGYPKHLLEALAGLCCQVDHWVSDAQPIINPEKTYKGKLEQFISDLEKPLNHCQSAK
jgi:hypothetical protein